MYMSIENKNEPEGDIISRLHICMQICLIYVVFGITALHRSTPTSELSFQRDSRGLRIQI